MSILDCSMILAEKESNAKRSESNQTSLGCCGGTAVGATVGRHNTRFRLIYINNRGSHKN